MNMARVALCVALVGWVLSDMPHAAAGGQDEVGEGRTQGQLTHLRAASELSRAGRVQPWYELSHPWSATMPQNPLAGSLIQFTPLPTSPFPGIPHQAANVETVLSALGHTGTQFDALGHFSHLPVGNDPASAVYYNGFVQAEVKPTPDSVLQRLGVENAPPILTTAVLLDAQRYFNRTLGPGEVVRAADLEGMIRVQHVRQLLPGDAVLVYTGWEQHWKDPDDGTYHAGAPGLSEDAARYLASKHVVAIGLDTPYIDPFPPPDFARDTPFIVHHIALVEAGIHLIENMRLSELARDRVYVSAFMVLPVRIVGGSGSPVRPVAIGAPHIGSIGLTLSAADLTTGAPVQAVFAVSQPALGGIAAPTTISLQPSAPFNVTAPTIVGACTFVHWLNPANGFTNASRTLNGSLVTSDERIAQYRCPR